MKSTSMLLTSVQNKEAERQRLNAEIEDYERRAQVEKIPSFRHNSAKIKKITKAR